TDGDGVNDVGERNVISGNANLGVLISDAGTSNNLVAGNYIGTNAAGTVALGNSQYGVQVQSSATNNTIGGLTPTPGACLGNVISGNLSGGINITSNNNLVQGNIVGLNAAGAATKITVANDGFEVPNFGTGTNAYQYVPSGASWTFVGGTGITANFTAW